MLFCGIFVSKHLFSLHASEIWKTFFGRSVTTFLCHVDIFTTLLDDHFEGIILKALIIWPFLPVNTDAEEEAHLVSYTV